MMSKISMTEGLTRFRYRKKEVEK